MINIRLSMLVCVSVLLVHLSSASAMEPIPGEERFETILSEQQTGGAELGYTTIDGEQFLTLTPRLDLNLGGVGLGIQVPLNIRSPIGQKEGAGDKDWGGVVRHEDWDGSTEWLKIIRYVRIGNKKDPYYLRVGELAADVGHGTIMGRYFNNLDPNQFRLGIQFDLNTKWGGVETIVNDFGANMASSSDQSQIAGVRFYVKPVAFIDSESLLNIFSLGFTTIADRNAPYSGHDASGEAVASRPESQSVWGIDFEADVLSNPLVDLTPYTDLNFISGAGMGWHLGLMSTFKLPIGLDLRLPIRVEYRNFQGNYIPTYFSTFYEKDRASYPGSDSASQSYHFKKDQKDAEGLSGYYADMAFDFVGLLQIGAFYEDYFSEGHDPNLAVFLNVPALDVVQFKAYYERRGISDTGDIFVMDDKSYAVAEGRFEIFNPAYLVARAEQRWVDEDGDGAFEEAEPEMYFGLEFSANF